MNGQEKLANGHAMQLTIRELKAIATSRTFWIGFFCVMGVLAVSGPFDTWDDFNAFGLFVYWSAIGLATFFPAMLVIRTLARQIMRLGADGLAASLLGGVISGPMCGLIVFLINTHVAGNDNGDLKGLVRLAGLCTPVAVAVAGLQHLMLGAGAVPSEAAPTRPVPLMERLRADIRGEVLSLRAQDHYVEVVTARGRQLVLMRLGDAAALLGNTDGRQVHRSWWVARAAVAGFERRGHSMELALSDGRRIPVGRARQAEVRAWLERRPPATIWTGA